MKYYAMYVRAGYEEKTIAYIRRVVPGQLYGDCFSPYRVVKKKFGGRWREVREKLLAGYVFVTTDQAEELYQAIRTIPAYIRMLGKSEDEVTFSPLTNEEEEWLIRLIAPVSGTAADGEIEIGLSEVAFDENDHIVIVSGPLKDMEGYIKKIHLHKRVAEVGVQFMNREVVMHLGIELMKKG